MSVNAEVQLNQAALAARIGKRIRNNVQPYLDQRILADSNFYAPNRDGFLITSGITASKIGEGILIWDEIYSKKQYYELPNKSTDKNPNARRMWFEEAKARKSKEWGKLAQEKYNDN